MYVCVCLWDLVGGYVGYGEWVCRVRWKADSGCPVVSGGSVGGVECGIRLVEVWNVLGVGAYHANLIMLIGPSLSSRVPPLRSHLI